MSKRLKLEVDTLFLRLMGLIEFDSIDVVVKMIAFERVKYFIVLCKCFFVFLSIVSVYFISQTVVCWAFNFTRNSWKWKHYMIIQLKFEKHQRTRRRRE